MLETTSSFFLSRCFNLDFTRTVDTAVKGIICSQGRLLLQLRDNKPDIYCPGCWGLFGGAIDKGETPETALRRELFEELFLTRFSMKYSFSWINPSSTIRLLFFAVSEIGSLDMLKLNEGQAMELFTVDSLNDLNVTDDLRHNMGRVQAVCESLL